MDLGKLSTLFLQLRWMGPILDCSGYASAARGYLFAADEVGIRIKASDRSRSINLKGKGMDDGIMAMYERLSKAEVADDCPTVQHQVPDQFFNDRKSKLRIGYTIFEMCNVPKEWAKCCNRMDVIWTGSKYAKSAFLNSGVKVPVKVLPHAIDLKVFNTAADPWPIANRRSFAFLSVFDFTERKAWKDLLRAYWDAFSSKDDVCLILKAYFGNFSEEAIRNVARKIKAFRDEERVVDSAPILLYGHDVPYGQMPGLYRSADCYVGVSREGFGLGYAEAMACGLPCIGPEVSGTRQFMTEENSFLVKYVGDEPVGPETSAMYPIFSGLRWAKHSWEHLSELMKKVVHDDAAREEKAEKGFEDVERELSPKKIGNLMADYLKQGISQPLHRVGNARPRSY
jgi:glycosyltransferase involved in cell wall biosynthesis